MRIEAPRPRTPLEWVVTVVLAIGLGIFAFFALTFFIVVALFMVLYASIVVWWRRRKAGTPEAPKPDGPPDVIDVEYEVK